MTSKSRVTTDLIIDKSEYAERFPHQFFLSADDLDHIKNLKDNKFDGCYIRNTAPEKLTTQFFSMLNQVVKDNSTVQCMVDQPVRVLQQCEARTIQMNAKFCGFDDFEIERQDCFEQLTDENMMGLFVTFRKVKHVPNENYDQYLIKPYYPQKTQFRRINY